MTVTWHVYQFRSETGELLYVGYTRHLKRRIARHRREKPWWPEVADIRSEEFAAEDDARQREKELWGAESPKYNKNSPFRTDLEDREADRKRRQTPEWRTYDRKRRQTPEWREAQREYRRAYERTRRRRPAARRWQQTGPGLF